MRSSIPGIFKATIEYMQAVLFSEKLRAICKELFEHERLHFSTFYENPKFPEDISGSIAREIFPSKKNYTPALNLVLETGLECVGIVLVDAGEPMLLNQGAWVHSW